MLILCDRYFIEDERMSVIGMAKASDFDRDSIRRLWQFVADVETLHVLDERDCLTEKGKEELKQDLNFLYDVGMYMQTDGRIVWRHS